MVPLNRERRRRSLINKPLQFRYMAWLLFILTLVTLSSLLCVYFGIEAFLYQELTDVRLLNDLLTAKRLDEYAQAQVLTKGIPVHEQAEVFRTIGLFKQRQEEVFRSFLDRLMRALSGKLFLLFTFIGLGTIYISHKVAGPLYRFDQSFKEVQRKNLSLRIRLRKFDEAKEVSESFNQMAETLDRSVQKMKSLLVEVKDPVQLKEKLSHELAQFKTTETGERTS